MRLSGTAKFAWFLLLYNVVVVVWGVFLRASKSGDGCGRYWLTCHGEVVPSAPELKTVIEFSHRVMSGVDFFLVLALLVLVLVYFKGRKQLRFFAKLSFIFIVTEALIGAGLVLTGNVADAYTDARPLWAIAHLINTFLLLGSLSITAWLLAGGRDIKLAADKRLLQVAVAGTLGIVFVGITGSVAALSNMLFPSNSFAESIAKDFAPDSHFLLRIRILHPIGSVAVAVLIAFAAAWIKSKRRDLRTIGRFSDVLSILIVIQVIFGGITLVTGAPIVMQLIHLLLADAVWISWVLLISAAMGAGDKNAD